jgi:hypothetical protein
MPKAAFVILKADGEVGKTHSPDVYGSTGSAGAGDLEKLLEQGYQSKREVALSDGKVLLVLEKP